MIALDEKNLENQSLFNRGKNLSKCLINSENVKNYLKLKTTQEEIPNLAKVSAKNMQFLNDQDSPLNDKMQWKLMMAYF